MPSIDLNTVTPVELQQLLDHHSHIVACLCADWCDVCKSYRARFESLAEYYSDILFMWIDIEDQSSLVDHLEVDNFPTLLIQRDDIVCFYGTMQSDPARLKRQIDLVKDKSTLQLQQLALQQPIWQNEANIRTRIADTSELPPMYVRTRT